MGLVIAAARAPPRPASLEDELRPPSRMLKNRVKATRLLSPTCFEGRRTRIGAASLAASNGGADVPAQAAGSSRRLGQIADADQVVDRQPEDEHPADPRPTAVAHLTKHADGLEPA